MIVRNCKKYTKEETLALIAKAHNGNTKARNDLFLANIGLVYKCCAFFRNQSVDFEDTISQGFIGLLNAIDSFKEEKQAALSTWAWIHIKKSVMRYNQANERTIRLPYNPGTIMKKIKKIRKKKGKLNKYQEAFLKGHQFKYISLDKEINPSSDYDKFHDIVADRNTVDIGDEIDKKMFYETALSLLDAPQKDILIRRLHGETLHSISKSYSITREAIRQRLLRIKEKIIKYAEKNLLF